MLKPNFRLLLALDKNDKTMKKTLLLLFFLSVASLYAQEETPPLYFEYDASGNQQVSALVCVNCEDEDPQAQADQDTGEETPAKHALSKLSYYPNPTEQQLLITWENTDVSRVTAVRVYDLSGKQVALRKNLNRDTQLPLAFGHIPAGIYTVEVLSSDGTSKTFKIIKK